MAHNMAAAYTTNDLQEFSTGEDFAQLFESYVKSGEKTENTVVTGKIVGIENGDIVVIDVGLKSEGRVPLKEFTVGGKIPELRIGDDVEVFLERLENKNGEAVVSRERALREEAWARLEKACEQAIKVEGTIFGRVKGGFTVDIEGAVAFLPGSQVDIRPIRDINPLIGISQPFMILKMDRKRGNIVVSRRAILEESRVEARNEILGKIVEGQELDGIVKNITDYGAFVDMGGIDGLLHVTDISWKRINHPSEMLHVGQNIKVIVTKFDADSKRVSLGMKQLEKNPWENISEKFAVGQRFNGVVTNLTDYGAFVELEKGIEGLVHVSEMSWTKKNIHPSKIVAVSQNVEVVILDIDHSKHRISLGMKQCVSNPWTQFAEQNKVGEVIEGAIRNITDFGLFIGLDGDIDGLVHHSDISWTEPGEAAVKAYKKGDVVKAKLLIIDVEKERIGLGIKQMTENAASDDIENIEKGAVVTCVVSAVQDGGIEVKINDSITAFIKKSDLSRDRQEQRPERFAIGDRIDAKVTSVDKSSHKVAVSIKALESDEQKRAIEEYGSADSGASLGDILGAALNDAKAKKK
jgi:small subunit ribosomal protein S1